MIIREFNLLDFKNKGKEEKLKKRFIEIFKSVKNPKFHILSDSLGDYVIFRAENGVVEYRLKASYSECLDVLCDLKEIKESKNERD